MNTLTENNIGSEGQSYFFVRKYALSVCSPMLVNISDGEGSQLLPVKKKHAGYRLFLGNKYKGV